MTKLKIDLNSGILEVEGEEAFVREIYQEYKERLLKNADTLAEHSPIESHDDPKPTHTVKRSRGSKVKTGTKRKESYSIVKNLDLSGKGGKKSLRDFFKEKSPSVALEKNVVFVYYLQSEAKITGITIDHIYSCYKDVSERVPRALKQSILDTSSKKGWIDTSSMADIKISTPGENLVEHDLPRKSSKDAKKDRV